MLPGYPTIQLDSDSKLLLLVQETKCHLVRTKDILVTHTVPKGFGALCRELGGETNLWIFCYFPIPTPISADRGLLCPLLCPSIPLLIL